MNILQGSAILACVALTPFAAAADERANFDAAVEESVVQVNAEASANPDAPLWIAALIRREYGTQQDELQRAADADLSWGEVLVLAYMQATTGRSFADMEAGGARRDFWSYAEAAGMSRSRLVLSLRDFVKKAKEERNSRIFQSLRASRRFHALPDLGSGFGLLQETLDFRRIDLPRPTKIHSEPGTAAKSGHP